MTATETCNTVIETELGLEFLDYYWRHSVDKSEPEFVSSVPRSQMSSYFLIVSKEMIAPSLIIDNRTTLTYQS